MTSHLRHTTINITYIEIKKKDINHMPSYLAIEILTLACRALPQGFESSLSLTIFLTIRPFCVFIKSFKWLWITYCFVVTICASSTLFLVLFWGFFFVFSKNLWTLTWKKKERLHISMIKLETYVTEKTKTSY